MKQRTATKLALWAAIVGVILSLYHRSGLVLGLGSLDIPWYQLVLVFFSGFNWIYCGLTVLLVGIVFRLWSRRIGAVAVTVAALIQVVFSVYAILPYFLVDSFGQLVGFEKYFSYLGIIWALTILVFSILYIINPDSFAVRGVALLVGLEAMLNLVLLLSIYSLDLIIFFNILAVTLIAQWFWLLFLYGNVPQN